MSGNCGSEPSDSGWDTQSSERESNHAWCSMLEMVGKTMSFHGAADYVIAMYYETQTKRQSLVVEVGAFMESKGN